MGRFMVPMLRGSVLYVCTKFEVDSSVREKVIRVPTFRNWVSDPGHAHLGVVYIPYAGGVRPPSLCRI